MYFVQLSWSYDSNGSSQWQRSSQLIICYFSFLSLAIQPLIAYAIVFQVLNEPADVHCPVVEMSTRSKLSCLSWNKYWKDHIASSDYEGIVTVWDVTTRQVMRNCYGYFTILSYITWTHYIFHFKQHFLFFFDRKHFHVLIPTIIILYFNYGFNHFGRVWWNMKNMKNEHGVLISHGQNPQCLYLVVMIARYADIFHILNQVFFLCLNNL